MATAALASNAGTSVSTVIRGKTVVAESFHALQETMLEAVWQQLQAPLQQQQAVQHQQQTAQQ